jgi:hypothetical protein
VQVKEFKGNLRWVFSVQPNEFKGSPQVLSAGLGLERVSNVRVIGASSAAEFRGEDSRVVVLVLVVVVAVHIVRVEGLPMVVVKENKEAGKNSNF